MSSKPEIEPRIAPLVHAVQHAGFTTFSSCEGHIDFDANPSRFASVGFFADETAARRVHEALFSRRAQLTCSWALRAGFVMSRDGPGWALGWSLENWGTLADTADEDAFIIRTVEDAWNFDIPVLIEMFERLRAA